MATGYWLKRVNNSIVLGMENEVGGGDNGIDAMVAELMQWTAVESM